MILRGEDRLSWLQGQVTNDLRRLASGKLSFCLCSATGQIESVLDSWAVADTVLMTCAGETASFVSQRAERMVILEDVVLEDAAAAYRVISIQGRTADRMLGELLGLRSTEASEPDAGEFRLADATLWRLRADRTGFGGWDLWIPRVATDALAAIDDSFAPISPAAFDVARLEAGIPAYGRDVLSRTLPPEMGPVFESAHVSYQKGCYVGQEVLMRIHSRGHANRIWMGILAREPIEAGARVAHPLRPDAGVVTSAAHSPALGYIGAAMLRQECAAPGERVLVIVDGKEVEAEVQPMPLRNRQVP